MIRPGDGEKKLILIFKSFVDKALVPQLKRDGNLDDWNKFSALLQADTLNYNDLQHFVNALPALEDRDPLARKRSEGTAGDRPFNPNQTVGGERSKLNILNIGEHDRSRESARDDSMRHRASQNSNNIVANLSQLLKELQQNQSAIDSQVRESEPTTPTTLQLPSSSSASKGQRERSSNAKEEGKQAHSYQYIPHQYSGGQGQGGSGNSSLQYLQSQHVQPSSLSNLHGYHKSYY